MENEFEEYKITIKLSSRICGEGAFLSKDRVLDILHEEFHDAREGEIFVRVWKIEELN